MNIHLRYLVNRDNLSAIEIAQANRDSDVHKAIYILLFRHHKLYSIELPQSLKYKTNNSDESNDNAKHIDLNDSHEFHRGNENSCAIPLFSSSSNDNKSPIKPNRLTDVTPTAPMSKEKKERKH